jgi:hypothetical protein
MMSGDDSVSAAANHLAPAFCLLASHALTIVNHASPNSSAAILPVTQYEIIIVEVTIAVSHAHTQDITNSITSWSATVPTPFAGVMAVSELCAFPVVMARRASRPTYISDISDIALPLTAAATLPQCSCRDGHRQQ